MQIYVYFHSLETFSFLYKKYLLPDWETSGYSLAKGAMKKHHLDFHQVILLMKSSLVGGSVLAIQIPKLNSTHYGELPSSKESLAVRYYNTLPLSKHLKKN